MIREANLLSNAQDTLIMRISPALAPMSQPSIPPLSVDDQRWQSLTQRASSGDFLYAVISTGIVCRPGCGSRLPLRKNVRFFDSLTDATRAGFRPCQRCQPDRETTFAPAAATAARFLADNLDRTVPLAELAQLAGISVAHLQRVFTQSFGVSPRRYAETLRVQALAAALPAESVTGATYTSGFSAPSRMYEAAARSGLQPRTLRRGGEQLNIGYTTAACPFGGRILAAATATGLCAISMADDDISLLADIRARFPKAHVAPRADTSLNAHLDAVINSIQTGTSIAHLPLDIRATAFQVAVWDALRDIPRGHTRTYSEVAASLGRPSATRAVARACASNPISLAIPCHRVVGASGSLTGYRWGIERKQRIIHAEQTQGAALPNQGVK